MNWKQEVANEIIGIEEVNASTALFTFLIDTGAGFFDGDDSGRFVPIERSLIVRSPAPVNLRTADGDKIRVGDWSADVSFVRLRDALAYQQGDPAVRIGDRYHSIGDLRIFDGEHNWGIVPNLDRMKVGGAEFTVIAADGRNFLNGEPAFFRLYLRRIA